MSQAGQQILGSHLHITQCQVQLTLGRLGWTWRVSRILGGDMVSLLASSEELRRKLE